MIADIIGGMFDFSSAPKGVSFGLLLFASLLAGAYIGADLVPPPAAYGPAMLLWFVAQIAALGLAALLLRGIRYLLTGRTSSSIIRDTSEGLGVALFAHGGALLAFGGRYWYFADADGPSGTAVIVSGGVMMLAAVVACGIYVFGGRSS
jgi:hypothetical protein